VALRILDWDLFMMNVLDLLAQPHSFYFVAPYRFNYRFVEE